MNESITPDLIRLENRFDILIKFMYARFREQGVDSEWPQKLYLEHIKIFNQFYENDGSGKCGKEAFLNSFIQLLHSIKEVGYSNKYEPIKLGKDGTPITGAHRITACMLYNKPIQVNRVNEYGPKFDYNYFRKYGLPEKFSDPAAIEYCRINKNASLIFLYPSSSENDNDARSILEKTGDIFYEKKVTFTKAGQVRLIRQAYRDTPWLGSWKDGYAGAKRKARYCFRRGSTVTVYVMNSDIDALLEGKLKIRALYEVENHSIHTTDNHEECLRLAQQIFNENSIRFLNTSVDKQCPTFDRLIEEYRRLISSESLDPELFCIDGSAVMSVYGMRDARDLDYIHLGTDEIFFDNPEVGNHNSELKFHPYTKDEMIVNPQHHFYYDGLKYTSIDVIRKMKEKRDEKKDRIDVELIDNYLKGMGEPLYLLLRRKILQMTSRAYIIAKLRGLKMSIDMLRYKISLWLR